MPVDRDELLEVVRTLNVLVVSLATFGAWTYDQDPRTVDGAFRQMVDDLEMYSRLAKARAVLSEYFDRTIGADDMNQLERELEHEKYWQPPK